MLEPSITSTFEQAPERAPLQGIRFGQATDTGRVRSNNEDHHGAAPDLGFFVVADGVGGAPAGNVASRLATAAMLCSLRARAPGSDLPESADPESESAAPSHRSRLVAAAHLAHKMIRDFAARNRCHGAATTMAALWVTGDQAHIANTGDSRVYRLCGNHLEQLTKDHNAYQEHVDRHGPLTRQWARALENVVTQVLGGKSGRLPEVHLVSRPIAAREVFLLCTDGLTKMVSEDDIALVLGGSMPPEEAASLLVKLANEAGGLDNTTVMVVHVEPQGTRESDRTPPATC